MDPTSPNYNSFIPNQYFQGTMSSFKLTIGSTVALEFGPNSSTEISEKFTLDSGISGGSYPVTTFTGTTTSNETSSQSNNINKLLNILQIILIY